MAEIQVLHVDDEPDMRLLVKLSLDLDPDISTHSASSGAEALDATTYWRPDVILLDAVMPGLDGLATLKALQANPKTAGIPVLFLTGKCGVSDLESFKASGSVGVIAKPFDPRGLAVAIRSCVKATALVPCDPRLAFGTTTPGFNGGETGSASADAQNGIATINNGGITAFGSIGTTTEVLLLDGNGNAFALTITDHSDNGSGTPPLRGDNGEHSPSLGTSIDELFLHLDVRAAPLDANTVNNLLGMEATGLIGRAQDKNEGADRVAIEDNTFKTDYAIGCDPSGAIDTIFVYPQKTAIVTMQHSGSVSSSHQWDAVMVPRALMH